MTQEEIIKQVKKVIKKLRPYLNQDGGDLDFVDFRDGIVYIKLLNIPPCNEKNILFKS